MAVRLTFVGADVPTSPKDTVAILAGVPSRAEGVKLGYAASDSSIVEEPTWVFKRGNQHLELSRRETDGGILLVMFGDGAPRSYRFNEMMALVNFQCDMEALLLKTGWSFVSFSPERRTGKERRTWPRLTERRRWWTDGQLWRLLGVRQARQHKND